MSSGNSDEHIGAPGTVIVLGSGCSIGLGVPTMTGFLEYAFAKLILESEKWRHGKSPATLKNDPYWLMFQQFKQYIGRIKGFGAYMHLGLLNMEDLYGLAVMLEGITDELKDKQDYDDVQDILSTFNRVLFLIYHKAGLEFLNAGGTFSATGYQNTQQWLMDTKLNSHSVLLHPNTQTNHNTNLLAYLGLASYQDDGGRYPAIIQFNWDLAFDRALWFLTTSPKSNFKDPRGGTSSQRICIWSDDEFFTDGRNAEPFQSSPLVIRPHGGLNWLSDKGPQKLVASKLLKLNWSKNTNPAVYWDGQLIHDETYIKNSVESTEPFRRGEHMVFVPPSWKKDISPLVSQWRLCLRYLERARRIVFIGYSLPDSDMNIRYFLALALARNNLVPKIYVWDPDLAKKDHSVVRGNYLQLFEPLAREWRLLGIPYKFGHPGLYDLERAIKNAEPITPAEG